MKNTARLFRARAVSSNQHSQARKKFGLERRGEWGALHARTHSAREEIAETDAGAGVIKGNFSRLSFFCERIGRDSPLRCKTIKIYCKTINTCSESSSRNLFQATMKSSSTIFLQVVIVALGVGALAFMLWEPHIEGRNANATFFEIYFKDPFLAYVYIASIAFFVALYQAFKLLGYVRQEKVFSLESVGALRTIKYCALALVGFIAGAEAYIFIAVRGKDDIAGGVAIGLVLIFASVVVATAAAVFERLLQTAVELKSENDLTV